MTDTKSTISRQQLNRALTEREGALALRVLNELEEQLPQVEAVQEIKRVLPGLVEPVLRFQSIKTARVLVLRLKATPLFRSHEIPVLLESRDRLDELALKLSNMGLSEAILATDALRTVSWQEFPAPVLPTFCRHFKRFGDVSDVDSLLELSRHPHPMVLSSALEALETIDPVNLSGLVLPLLENPNPAIKSQATRALYRLDKPLALHHWSLQLFADNPTERELALLSAEAFAFRELEPYLLKFAARETDPGLLVRLQWTFQQYADFELPHKLYKVCRSMSEPRRPAVKSLLLGVVRSLPARKLIEGTSETFLTDLRSRIRAEEDLLLDQILTLEPVPETEPDFLETPAAPEPEAPISVEAPIPVEEPGTAPPPAVGESSPRVEPLPGEESWDVLLHRLIDERQPRTPVTSAAEASSAPAPDDGQISLKRFLEMSEDQRLDALNELSSPGLKALQPELGGILKTSGSREKAAIVKMLARLRSMENSHFVTPLLNSDQIDLVGAVIDALCVLDFEYLAIYLPKLMQNSNGRIRRHAVQAFAAIDQKQLCNLISAIFRSNDPRERAMAIGPCAMVDFPLVRNIVLQAFATENIAENLEKIGLLLISNPDRDLFHRVFTLVKRSANTPEGEIKKKITLDMAEKLSVALGKTESAADLLEAEETRFAREKAKEAKKPKQPPSAPSPEPGSSIFSLEAWVRVAQGFSFPPYVWVLLGISWLVMIVDLIVEYWHD